MDPYDETAWTTVIGSPGSVRSIFLPRFMVSLNLVSRYQILKVIHERTPFSEFRLESFRYNGIDLSSQGFHCELWVTDLTPPSGPAMSSLYQVKWKSYYRRRDGSYQFTYRPQAIFVLIPKVPTVTPEEIPQPVKPAVKILPLVNERVIVVLQTLQRHSLSRKSALVTAGVRQDQNKSGFGGRPSRPPVSVSEPAYVATFSSNSPSTVENDGVVVRMSRTQVSTSTPNFRALRKALLPVNPYALSTVVTKDGGMFSSLFEPTPGISIRKYQTRSEGTRFPNFGLPGFDPNLYNKTLYKAQEQSGSSIEANIAQDVAQLGQLKLLIASTTKKLSTSIAHVREKKFYQAALDLVDHAGSAQNMSKNMSVSKNIASNWLALQYGWKPLLQDVHGLMKTLAQTVVGRPTVYTIRASSRKTSQDRINVGPMFTGSTKDIFHEYKYNYFARIGIRYTVHDQFISAAQQLGLTNPINLAWEVLPYSFVVDWFLPIGPALSSLTAWQGLTFKDGYVTQSVRREFSSAFDVSFSNFGTAYVESAAFQQVWFRLAREVLTDFPRVDIPRPKDPVSLVHALNGIALLRARF